MPVVSFLLRIDPVPASRPRVTRNGISYYADPYKSFKKDAPAIIRSTYKSEPITGLVNVHIKCYVLRPKTTKLLTPRPDVDNYAKAVLDAMNGIVLEDDRQVVKLVVEKCWAAVGADGGIEVGIERID